MAAYHLAASVVDEALSNLAAVGGDNERAAILDNFCWGNPTDPTQLGMLVRAVKGCYDAAAGFGTPFISGKDSLNNEYRSAGERLPVIPTLLISAVGVIDDASQTVDMSLKHPGNLLYQIGITHNELAGSHYAEIGAPLGGATLAGATLAGATLAGAMPHVDIETARTTMKALGSAIRKGLVQACHDLSEGGLAVAAAEMSLAGLLGMTIDVGLVPFVGARSIAPQEWDGKLTPGDTGAQDELNTILLHINQLLKAPQRLLDYDFLVIPGGFSYGDDLGAGTLLAKNLVIHLGSQLQQSIDEGRLILGICNGFQPLVRAGLLPAMKNWSFNASHIPVTSLTNNASAQFECRWITLSPLPAPCIFTKRIHHHIELPVAHGEGRFVLADAALLSTLQANGQIPLVYTMNARQISPSSAASLFPYPDNPNGSMGNIAGVCNAQGNVFGLMPHPEPYSHALQHPRRRGTRAQGDGLLIFRNAFAHAKKMDAINRASTTYASSGVDIAAADSAKELMKEAVQATPGPEVLAGMSAFAGICNPGDLQQMRQPALVASTDGVGTKTLLAAQAGRFDTVGYDLVNHSVNDLLTQGARPLFFMDYLAMGKLDPVVAATIVTSVAAACREVGCALLGGETAEMPGVYLPGAFDLACTIVCVVEQDAITGSGQSISMGEILQRMHSSGQHAKGS